MKCGGVILLLMRRNGSMEFLLMVLAVSMPLHGDGNGEMRRRAATHTPGGWLATDDGGSTFFALF